MKCYQIETIHWAGKKGTTMEEFVVAKDMARVVKYLETDLRDRGLEVKMIREVCPITKILSDK